MRLLVGSFVCLLAVVGSAKCDIEEEEGVLILTDQNIDEAIKDNKFLMVKFYVPCTEGDCGKYKEYWTRYNMAADMLKEAGNPAKLGKVNIMENPFTSGKNNPVADPSGQARPTIVLFKEGIRRDYTDKVKSRNIVPYMERRTRPLAVTLDTAKAIEDIKENNQVVIIGFFSDAGSLEAKEFVVAANGELDEQEFAIVSDPALISKFGVDNTIVLYKKFDEGEVVMKGAMLAETISTFVLNNYLPLVFTFSRKESRRIFGQPSEGFLAILDSTKAEGHGERMELAHKLAREYKGRVTFVFTDTVENAELLEYLHEKETPTFMMLKDVNTPEIKNFKTDNPEFSEKNLKQFIDSFLAGKVPVWIPPPKSEELPADWDKAPVKVLVGSNFVDVAMDKEKDVLVEFYAPWCGHCQKLAPIFDKLGEHFKDVSDVVISKMDATANEVHGVKVSGFPTIQLYKKGTNEVVEFNGGRELKDFIKFLKENGVKEPKKPKKEEL